MPWSAQRTESMLSCTFPLLPKFKLLRLTLPRKKNAAVHITLKTYYI